MSLRFGWFEALYVLGGLMRHGASLKLTEHRTVTDGISA
jgi:hypothetical protein